MNEAVPITGVKVVADPEIETAPIEDGAILFDPTNAKFFILNRAAACLWDELSSPATEDRLVERLRTSFSDLDENRARRDAREVVEHMLELGVASVAAEQAI